MDASQTPSPRDRVLIALAKLLGKESRLAGPPLGLLTEDWHFEECLARLLPDEASLSLTRSQLNELLLHCGRGLITQAFYDHFFGSVASVEEFEAAIDRFRVVAMLLFGNFGHALQVLGAASPEAFERLVHQAESRPPQSYSRPPFTGIEPIDPEDLFLLGYVSRERLLLLETGLHVVEKTLEDGAAGSAMWSALGEATRGRLLRALQAEELPPFDIEARDADLRRLEHDLRVAIGNLAERRAAATAIGLKNTQRYLTLPILDVYFATSMRAEEHYVDQQRFITDVFACDDVRDLNLRYFDPTLSYVDDRITKGLIECLMLKRASVTVYHAGAEDSLGKDSELAATLAQGKWVIVYVPEGPAFDRRAELFRVQHPLGLQVDARTGVAHGVLVARTPQRCAALLRGILLRELQYEIRHEGGNYQLVEKSTESVVRVVSDDPLLTHSFWTFFHHPQ